MEIVTSKMQMDEWFQNPDKLLAFIAKLFWEAGIEPESGFVWYAKDGKIIIEQNPKKKPCTVER